LDTIEALDRKRKLALTALQEKLTDAKKDRPEMLSEITIIESALETIEDLDKYIERFNELEVVVDAFIAEARGWPPNPANIDRLNRLKNIRDDLNVYKNAYTNHAVALLSKREGD
jgi:hypothetical protein